MTNRENHELGLPFTLTVAERMSPLWQRFSTHLEQKLHEARAKNDGPLDPMQTAEQRGLIRSYKSILALGVEQPPTDE